MSEMGNQSDYAGQITPEDIVKLRQAGLGAEISKLFLEDEFVEDMISPEVKPYFDAIRKVGIGQYDKKDVEKLLKKIDSMKTTFIMSSMESEYTWQHEREFTMLSVLAIKNTSMGIDGTFLKRAFGSIQETNLVQTMNSPQQARPGLIASFFSKKR
ncbi:MAG: hypothetical protein LBU81_01900 [Methanosarcinales archaeon]|jgi:hypothetical protein|nr:hypothetical protein [Methanosarcinales archaeon]